MLRTEAFAGFRAHRWVKPRRFRSQARDSERGVIGIKLYVTRYRTSPIYFYILTYTFCWRRVCIVAGSLVIRFSEA